MHYDIFNGDADGITALIQLRLDEPRESVLITGVKRDIKLLSQLEEKTDVSSVTALDISMEKNMAPLLSLLEQGIDVLYCDHHRAGEIPQSSHLQAIIDLDAEICTSLLINKKLSGRHANWAVAGAFGDNLFASAEMLASEIGLSAEDTAFLKELGTLINYNGYGSTLDDLHIPPAELYKMLLEYSCPLSLRDDLDSPYYVLKRGYESDYQHIASLKPILDDDVACIFELPCEAWARRMSGVFGNELANRSPEKAHAVLTLNTNGEDYTVSVRAPLANRTGADEVCSAFPTGGGRKAAAGINALPITSKQDFIEALCRFYK